MVQNLTEGLGLQQKPTYRPPLHLILLGGASWIVIIATLYLALRGWK